MPKILEYPRASLKACLDLAKAVSELGGTAKLETAAERIGMKISGALNALVGSAGKYGLVENAKGALTCTPLYKELKNAYGAIEEQAILRKVFLGIPVFQKVHARFIGNKLPTDILAKMLIREFGVEEGASSRVAGYLIEAGQMCGLVKEDHLVVADEAPPAPRTQEAGQSDGVAEKPSDDNKSGLEPTTIGATGTTDFVVHFKGPGIDSKVKVVDEDDLLIVDAMMKKIRRKLGESGGGAA